MKSMSLGWALLALFCISSQVLSQETIQQVLAGKRSTLNFPISDLPPGVVEFRVQYESRTLATGKAARTKIDAQDTATIDILISETLVSPLKVEIDLRCGGKNEAVPLVLFPAKAFQENRSLFSRAKIQLFDPRGNTAKIFQVYDVPFETTKSIQSLPKESKLLVIGEGCEQLSGVDFANTLLETASQLNVLCLLPANQNIELNAPDYEIRIGQTPKTIADANLESFLAAEHAWRPGRDGDTLRLEAVENSLGWSWIRVTQRDGEASSIALTGLPLIAKHDQVPAARHILSKLIEHQIKSSSDRKDNDVFKNR